MQQVFIDEEVLKELRKKHGGEPEAEVALIENAEEADDEILSESTVKEIMIAPDAFAYRKSSRGRKKGGKGNLAFVQILAVQGILAAVLFALILTARFFSPEWHEFLFSVLVAQAH